MDCFLKFLREGSYGIVDEVDEMPQRRINRETNEKTTRPNASLDSTKEPLIEHAPHQTADSSNRVPTRPVILTPYTRNPVTLAPAPSTAAPPGSSGRGRAGMQLVPASPNSARLVHPAER